MNHEHNAGPAPSIHDPVREIAISTGMIQIKEMPWMQALKFIKMLSDHCKTFQQPDGSFKFETARLAELIAGIEHVSFFLLLHSTGKDNQWVESLPLGDALLVLDAALSLNISPEIMGRAKKIGSRFVPATNGANKNATEPTTKESPPALIS